MYRLFPLFFLLVSCVLQPITDPRRPDPETEPTMVPTAIAVEKPTYVVERGSVSAQLFKSGRITPIQQAQLGFMIEGQLATLLVAQGDVVQAGEVVAMLETAVFEQALQAAEADLALAQEQLAIAQAGQAADRRRAEIGVELAQLQLDFAVERAGSTATSEQLLAIEVRQRELELAELALAELDSGVDPSLANQVTQAQRQIERIETQIGQSVLVAPIAGTITAVLAAPGDRVASEETVLVVADLEQVEVQLSLLDRELQPLSEGMAAVGTLPARPETNFPMTVRQLPFPYGTGAEAEGDGSVRVAFAGNAAQVSELSIGERIEVAILLEQHEDVLWLPPAAIREFNGRLFVVVQEGETQKRLDIKVGLQNENQIEIISGLADGQLVVGP